MTTATAEPPAPLRLERDDLGRCCFAYDVKTVSPDGREWSQPFRDYALVGTPLGDVAACMDAPKVAGHGYVTG